MRLLGLVVALVACSAPPRPLVAQLPADATLVDGDATFVALDRYRGKVVVLDFWAGWCAECKRSVPQVARLARKFAPDGLLVVGVNAGDRREEAARYAQQLGIDYPIALDPELELSDKLGGGRLPLLVVLDRDGTIVHRAKMVDEETLRVIRALLHGKR